MRIRTLISIVVFGFVCQSIVAQNTNLSNGLVFDGEPFIAQNPANPNHLVVAWMGFVFNSGTGLTIRTKASFDGGISWSTTVPIPHESDDYAAADPSLAIAENGDVLLCYIDHQQEPFGGGVYFRRSSDGGLSWGSAVLAIDIFADGEKYPIDRPWFGMSTDGQFVYLTSMPPSFVEAPNRPYLFQSNDGGATWSNFEYIDGPGGLVGNFIPSPMAAPALGAEFAYTIYPSYVASQNLLPTMLLSKQAIGSNERAYFEALVATSTATPGSAKMGYKLLVNPFNNDHLTAFFVAGEGSDLDIKSIDSYDAGENWTQPMRINDDGLGNDRMQDLVWADFDSDGDLCVAWRDRRNGGGAGYEQATEIYCACRIAGETTFLQNFALSAGSTPHNAILEENGNDFMSLVLESDTLHAVWGSTTDGSLDIWYTRHALADEFPSVPSLLANEKAIFNVLDEANAWLVFSNSKQPLESVLLFDSAGQMIDAMVVTNTSQRISKSGLTQGLYVIKVKIGGIEQSIKVVLK